MTLSTVDIKAALKGMFTTLLIMYIIFFFTKINFVEDVIMLFKGFVGKIA
jgi:hypothetical protein